MSSFVKLWSAHLAAQIKVEQLRLVADVVAGIQSKFIACFSNSNKLVLNTCSADGGLWQSRSSGNTPGCAMWYHAIVKLQQAETTASCAAGWVNANACQLIVLPAKSIKHQVTESEKTAECHYIWKARNMVWYELLRSIEAYSRVFTVCPPVWWTCSKNNRLWSDTIPMIQALHRALQISASLGTCIWDPIYQGTACDWNPNTIACVDKQKLFLI